MTADDLARVRREAHVSALLSLQHDDCHAYWKIDSATLEATASQLGLAFARCPIRDFDIEDMRRQLPQAISTLARFQAAGHRTYVHCTAGLGRAPLTVLGFLTLVEGWNPERAIRRILEGRPGAVPAWEAYHGCVADLVSRLRPEIERNAYDLYLRGVNGSATDDWRQAEAETLRARLLAQGGQPSR